MEKIYYWSNCRWPQIEIMRYHGIVSTGTGIYVPFSTSSGRTKYVENVGRTDDDVDTSQRHKSQQPSNGFSMRHFRQCN